MRGRAWIMLAGLLLAFAAAGAPTDAAIPGYVNPFANPAWKPWRIDMGIDWKPRRALPVVAIGQAVILGSDNHAQWPGHHLIWYQLLSGDHAGDVIYVAEHLRSLVPAGTAVNAEQQIAVALPGRPWTEWGFANPGGGPIAWACHREGKQTRAGKEMARFLAELGARTAKSPGTGPDHPLGTRCW
jgi:hypothetical protein